MLAIPELRTVGQAESGPAEDASETEKRGGVRDETTGTVILSKDDPPISGLAGEKIPVDPVGEEGEEGGERGDLGNIINVPVVEKDVTIDRGTHQGSEDYQASD